jgi:Uma2 family endonuclease
MLVARGPDVNEPVITRMSAETFLEWGLHQELRYELVDGVPVAMSGATQRHDRVVANVHGKLYNLMRGKKCGYFTADLAVRIPMGNIRRADAGIDCGVADDDDAAATEPFVVLEVLSPSTRDFDMFGKLEEYKTVSTLAHIVIVDPDSPQVFHWSRSRNEPWRHELLEGLDAVIQLPEFEGVIDLVSLYEGLTFKPLPRLVREGDALA